MSVDKSLKDEALIDAIADRVIARLDEREKERSGKVLTAHRSAAMAFTAIAAAAQQSR